MKKSRWFEKFIGCAFTIYDSDRPRTDEYIFMGTCINPDTKSGYPLQYEFQAEGKAQVLLDYKEAYRTMGTMIEKYSK